ncbi:MAG: STAS domain-containing protein [Streptosporangiales bacterium]|nr:STAS domain-containing protein [Streptosporangiales bacterium]
MRAAVSKICTSAYAIERGDHACVAFGGQEDHRRLLSVHLSAALERGEKILYAGDIDCVESITDWLGDDTAISAPPAARGQLTVRVVEGYDGFFGPSPGAGEAFAATVAELLRDETTLAQRTGYTGLRACLVIPGELGTGPEPVLDQERSIDRLIADGRPAGVSLICQYDRRRFSSELLREVERSHPIVLDPLRAQQRQPLLTMLPLDRPLGLLLNGEIDRSNMPEFAAALRAALRVEDDFHLDMARLYYADVDAVELVAQIAMSFGSSRRLILRSPAPIVRTTLRIYGWDRLPALSIVDF